VTVRGSGGVARHRRRGPRVLAACAVAALAAAAGGAGAAVLAHESGTAAAWFAGAAGAGRVAGDEPPAGAPPTRVRIPTIGVDSALEPLRLDASGALAGPKDYAEAGWYADGTVPGDVGPAVIAGHIDSTRGPAVFYRLGQLHPGDLVEVARSGRWLAFRVVAVGRYPKHAFPTAAVYGPTPDPQLRLITCGGAFDRARRSYVDNTVVYAVAE
jgi:hypothetical protein